MVSLASTAAMVSSLQSAHDVTFSSYFLKPGPVEEALVAAARRRGVRVHARLEATLYGGSSRMTAQTRSAFKSLQKVHADVRAVHARDTDGPALHIKAAVCDGVAFLDDRNWNMYGDTVLRDDTPSHVRAIRDAILHQHTAGVGRLALRKGDALQAEAHMLSASHTRVVDVETEFLGGTGVSKTLRELRARGVRCRLLISERAYKHDCKTTHTAAQSLAGTGVDVRLVTASGKIAIAGTHAWVGSANATSIYPHADAVEWSLTTSDKRVLRTLKKRFDMRWKAATPLQSYTRCSGASPHPVPTGRDRTRAIRA
jgi:PLD-like domain